MKKTKTKKRNMTEEESEKLQIGDIIYFVHPDVMSHIGDGIKKVTIKKRANKNGKTCGEQCFTVSGTTKLTKATFLHRTYERAIVASEEIIQKYEEQKSYKVTAWLAEKLYLQSTDMIY